MQRKNFLKSLLALPFIPSIAKELGKTNFVEAAPVNPNKAFISQLQLLTPQYYKEYIEKYADEDFTWWLSEYQYDKTKHNPSDPR